MPDIPASIATTTSISVGGTLVNSLETVGDRDWIAVTLTAGQSVVISLSGTGVSPVEDTYLRLRDSSGTIIASNDDTGSTLDSQIVFTATSTGTYYIDVGSYNDSYSGQYELSVEPVTIPPAYTNDQIANQLTHGFWGGNWHAFDVGQGGSLTVNLTELTADGRTLARAALAQWTEIIGVNFVEVTSGGQITFDDDESGAFASSSYSGNVTTSAHVNVSTAWLSSYGTGLDSYSYVTYLHEIGHALGLGHAGNYDGSATYPVDALFGNDSWSTSLMSYFSQNENTYFSSQGFTYAFPLTPTAADILAMQTLYGLSTTTRTGNTTYGCNSNAGNPVYNALLYGTQSVTIFDRGGTDTLDYSGFAVAQTINLNAETFSSVAGAVGNLSIARGTVIENANGGSGNDTLIGNAVANRLIGNAGSDTLNGGAGADIMRGGLGNDIYYVENLGDSVIENSGEGTDHVYSSVTFALRSNVENLTLTGSAFRGNGNNLSNLIIGNDSANIINAGLGADEMRGGGGNDIYYVDNAGDTVVENSGAGRDRVYSTVSLNLAANVEDLFLRGSSNINATGNNRENVLVGNSGANVLTGGTAADDLRGGGGADTFVFDDGHFGALGASTCDRIIDFRHAENDIINLAQVDSNSGVSGDQAFNFIGTSAFNGTAGQLRYQQSGGNTYIYGDTNGDGDADFMLRLDGTTTLVTGDFIL